MSIHRRLARRLTLGLGLILVSGIAGAQGTFINWENPPVHPLDLSPDGSTLAVANLADGRVEFYDLSLGVPVASGQVEVGIDPTAVRFRNNNEVWAVNHISDTVTVIDVGAKTLSATIDTLDAPQDVIFAGSPERAFVACSGVSTLQVFDPVTRSQTGTVPVDVFDVNALAKSADGTKVYVTVFHSGNGTTILGGGQDNTNTLTFPANVVSDPLGPYGGVNPPPNNGSGFKPAKNPGNGAAPAVGLIVRKNAAGQWMDDNNGNWTNFVSGAMAAKSSRQVGWDLPDRDLAVIDTATLNVSYVSRLMNICMGVSVNPANGKVYVIGTEATNEIRFEPNLTGTFVRVHLAIVDPAGPSATIVDLNPHLDYSEGTVPQSERDKSIGDPRGIAWNADGTRGYVTGMGSNNLVVIDADGTRVQENPVALGAGPTGVVHDPGRGLVYALNRFDGSISVLGAGSLSEVARVSYFDPSPTAIKTGRKHLYDTHKNSGLGQTACASCHVDGKMDKLAWDLGDPSGALKSTAGQNDTYGLSAIVALAGGSAIDANWHPMKGPMTTQTFQDIIGKEPLHWRGDRFGLEEFNAAFIGLQGDDTNLDAAEMQEFENFVATIYFPPNPYRNFDNTLPTNLPLTGHFATGRFTLPAGAQLPNGNAQSGLTIYRDNLLDAGAIDCVTCHTLPTGAGGNQRGTGLLTITFSPIAPGPFGEKHLALVSVDGSTQDAIKIPQTRNIREKSGLEFTPGNLNNRAGFGYTHDGAVDSITRFVTEPIFRPVSDQETANLVAFMLSFAGSDLPAGSSSGTISPRNLEPPGEPSNDSHAATGRQVTITTTGANATITAMIAEANENGTGVTRGVDLVVKGISGGVLRGWAYDRASGNFRSDRDSDALITPANLRALAGPSTPQTYTVVPRGSGLRLGIDRDGDTFGDRTEIEACTDPANPASVPSVGSSEINVTPALGINFGDQNVSAGATAGQDVQVNNLGPGPLHFKGAKFFIAGAHPGDFGVINAPSVTPVPIASTRTVTVAFDPTATGARSATLYIVTDDCDEGIVAVPLSGNGTDGGATPTPTSTATASPTASPSPTATPSPSATASPTASATASPTASPTASSTASPTASPTESASPTATPTPSPSPSASPTFEPSLTPTPTASPTATATPTASPTASPAATDTPTETPTITPTDTAPDTPTPSPTDTIPPTPTDTPYHGRPYGDFNDSGCTDLDDFLFLLDYWQTEVNGEILDVQDFLALLDNWQSGPNC